jgi:hypothetical protein
MDEGRRYGLHKGLCHRVRGCREGRQSETRGFMSAVFTVFGEFGVDNHPEEYNIPGLWPSRSAQSVFQRYKRLKADCLRFEGEFRRVSGIHLTSEPREKDFVCIATAKDNLASGILSASESGNAYDYIGANAKSSGRPSSIWRFGSSFGKPAFQDAACSVNRSRWPSCISRFSRGNS